MRLRVGAALLLLLAAAGTVNYLRPIPAVAAIPLLPPTDTVPGVAPNLPWPSHGEAAVGVSGLGLVASSGNEQAIPAASVTKVMTGLIVLDDKPLTKHHAGPLITTTARDAHAYTSAPSDLQSLAERDASAGPSAVPPRHRVLVTAS